MSRAFIIGNGTSRRGVDLTLLPRGAIFGCNALYRDFKPDYLVAIDKEIITEIRASDFPQHRVLVPALEERFEPREYSGGKVRSNAGMNAMTEAIRRGHTELYCIGFDFLVQDDQHILKNIYDGTSCYGPETRTSLEDSKRRCEYLQWYSTKHGTVKFVFVFPRQELELHDIFAENVSAIYTDDFLKMLESENDKVSLS